MQFEEFQHLARLSAVGTLDADERIQFEAGCREFGADAERFLQECQKLPIALALSLTPSEPDPEVKERLMACIRQ